MGTGRIRTCCDGLSPADSFYQIVLLHPATGRETRRLTRDLAGDHLQPAWSPDGHMVAYVIAPQSDPVHGYLPWVLAVVGSDGSKPHVIATDPDGRFLYAPTWTPDGRIVYASGMLSSPDAHLEVINADGTNRRVLTATLHYAVPAVAPRFFSDATPDPNGVAAATPTTSALESGTPAESAPVEPATADGQDPNSSTIMERTTVAVAIADRPTGGPTPPARTSDTFPARIGMSAIALLLVALVAIWRRARLLGT